MERTQIFFEFDLNEHSVLAALLIDGKDFCGDGSHLGHFLRLTSPEVRPVYKASGTGRHRCKRELATLAHFIVKIQSVFARRSIATRATGGAVV